MNLADVLVHCANHSTYHRGQLVTMMRQVGAEASGHGLHGVREKLVANPLFACVPSIDPAL